VHHSVPARFKQIAGRLGSDYGMTKSIFVFASQELEMYFVMRLPSAVRRGDIKKAQVSRPSASMESYV
jgi:hypothetical protein